MSQINIQVSLKLKNANEADQVKLELDRLIQQFLKENQIETIETESLDSVRVFRYLNNNCGKQFVQNLKEFAGNAIDNGQELVYNVIHIPTDTVLYIGQTRGLSRLFDHPKWLLKNGKTGYLGRYNSNEFNELRKKFPKEELGIRVWFGL